MTGELLVQALGDIRQSGALTLNDNVSLYALGHLVLDDRANNLAFINDETSSSSIKGSSVTLAHSGAVTLGIANISSASGFAVYAADSITQSGAVMRNGAELLLSAGTLVMLDDAANDFAALGVMADAATLVDSSDMTLVDSSIASSLMLSVNGDLSQLSGHSLIAGGNISLSASGAIRLLGPANVFGALDVLAASATLAGASDFTLGSRVSVVGGLTLSTGGMISQSGVLTLDGAISLSSAGAVVLDHPGNDLQVVNINAASAVLVDVNDFTLGGQLVVSDSLTVSAGGGVYQSGALTVRAALSLSAAGAVVLTGSGNDLGLLQIQAASATLVDVNDFTLASGILVPGGLTVSAGGTIGQSGALMLDANVLLSSGAAVVLDTAGNNLGSVVNISARSATLATTNAFTLGSQISVVTDLVIRAGTSFYQSGALTLSGNISVSTGSGGEVNLSHISNDLTGLVVITADMATLVNSRALTLGGFASMGVLIVEVAGDLSQSGALTLSQLIVTKADAVVLNEAANRLDRLSVTASSATLATDGGFTLGSNFSVSDALIVSAADGITQSGAFTHSGQLSLSSGANLVLNHAANAIARIAGEGASMTLENTGDLVLGNIQISGALTISVLAGAISDGIQATSVLAGSTRLVASGVVVLDNRRAGQEVHGLSALDISAASLTLAHSGALDLRGSVSGALSLALSGDVHQDSGGALTVGAALDISTPGAIRLDASNNNFSILALRAASARVDESGGVLLGDISTGTLTLSVIGATGVEALSGADISVDGLSLGAERLVLTNALVGIDRLALNAMTAMLSVSGALMLEDSNIGDILVLEVLDDLVQSSGHSLLAVGQLSLSAGGHIGLQQLSNEFGVLQLRAASAAVASDTALTLGGGTSVTSRLAVNAVGDISQSGALTLRGDSSLYSGGAVVLTVAGNSLGGLVNISALSASLSTAQAFTLGGLVSVVDSLTVSAGTNLLQSVGLTLNGDISLLAAGAVVLDSASNDLGLVVLSASAATLVNMADLTLAGASSVTGALSIAAAGDISQSGALTLADISLSSTAAVVFNSAGNSFGIINLTGSSATLATFNAFTLGAHISVADSLEIRANGDIGQSGALTLGANISLSSTGEVVLTHADNRLGAVALEASSATLVTSSAFTLGAKVSVVNALELSAGGNIGQSGGLTLQGSISLSSSGAVILDSISNDLGEVSIQAASATLAHTGNFTLGGNISVIGSLTLSSTGDIGQSGALVLNGGDLLSANGAVVLDNASNSFAGALQLSATSATLRVQNNLTLGASSVTGGLSLNAGGAVLAAAVTNALGLVELSAASATLFNSGNLTLGGDSSVTGDLSIGAAGTIGQSGALTLNMRVSLQSDAAVVFNSAGNSLGEVNIAAPRADLHQEGDYNIAAGRIRVTDSLTIGATGNIAQISGSLSLGGIRVSLSAAGDVLLVNASNDFGVIALRATNALLITNKAVTLGGQLSVARVLAVRAGGDIRQSGSLWLQGDISLSSGGAVVLTHPDNVFSIKALSAASATLVSDTFVLTSSFSVAGALTVSASASISQSGAVTLGAPLLLSADRIFLLDFQNDFTGAVGLQGSRVVVVARDSLTLDSNVSAGSMTIIAGTSIVQSGGITVDNELVLDAQVVMLESAENNLHALALNALRVTLVNADAVELQQIEIEDALSIQAGGDIGQSRAQTLLANTYLRSSGAIVLDRADNVLEALTVSAASATLGTAGAFTLGAHISVATALTVSAGGAIVQSGALVQSTSLSLSSAGEVVLDALSNDFGLFAIQANSATLVDIDAFTLGANVSVVSGLSIAAGGDISQSGAVVLPGVVSLSSPGAVVLDNPSNDFDRLSLFAASATLADMNALTLGASVAGALTVVAGGDIVHPGELVLNSPGLFRSNGAVVLADASNNFSPGLQVSAASATLLNRSDLELGAISVSGMLSLSVSGAVLAQAVSNQLGLVVLSASTATLVHAGGAMTLAGTSSVADMLSIAAAGDISQSGALTLGASISLSSGGNLVFNHAGNRLGVFNLAASSATLVTSNAFTLGAHISVVHSLEISVAGDIGQSGALTLGANTSLSSTGEIVLTNADNRLGAVALQASSATLVTNSAFTLGARVSVVNTLELSAGGDIGQSGALVLQGNISLSSSGAVVLNHIGNDLGEVNIRASSATLVNAGDLIVGGEISVIDRLTLSAGGDISQSTILRLNGTALLSAGGALVLNNSSNTFAAALQLSAVSATLMAQDNLTLGASSVMSGFSLSAGGTVLAEAAINALGLVLLSAASATLVDAGHLTLGGASSVTGGLHISAVGAISQSGALTLNALVSLSSAGAIVLSETGNNLDAANITAASATIANTGDFRLGGRVVVRDSLTLSATGTISQSGSLVLTGDAVFSAGAAVILVDASNDFVGLVALSAPTATLADQNALMLGASSVTGELSLSVVGEVQALDLSNNFNMLVVQAASATLVNRNALQFQVSVTGDLWLRADGDLMQSGALIVPGTGQFNSSGAVVLDHVSNDFVGLVTLSAASATLFDINSLSLGSTTIAGTLSLSAGAAVVAEAATNALGLVAVSAASGTLVNSSALTLGMSSVTNALSLRADGNIDQVGALLLGGELSLSSGGEVVLDNASNDFGVAALSAVSATLASRSDLRLSATSISGALYIAVGGGLAQDGALVSGRLSVSAVATVVLDAANTVAGPVELSAASATLVSSNGLMLGESSVTGALSIRAGSSIDQSGALLLGGELSLSSSGLVLLDDAGNALGLVRVRADSATLVSAGDFTLGGDTSVATALTINAAGGISQSGVLALDSARLVLSSAAAVVFDEPANDLGALALQADSATLASTGDFTLGGQLSVMSSLTLKSGGDIGQSGAVQLAGNISLSSSGSVVLSDTSNDFIGELVVRALSATLFDMSGLTLGAGSVTGALLLSAVGAVRALNQSNDFGLVTLSAASATLVHSGALTLAASSLSGALTISAAALSQLGALTVGGQGLFSVSGEVALNNAENNIIGEVALSASSATLVDRGSLLLGTSSVTDALTISAVGDIHQLGGALTLGAQIVLSSGGAVVLNNVANDYGLVNISARSATLADVNAFTLGGANISVADSLTVTAVGDISQSGVLLIPGVSLLLSSAATVVLDEAFNELGAVAVQADSATLVSAGAFTLGGHISVASSLTLSAGGDIGQSGALSLRGNNVSISSAAAVVLDDSSNDLGHINLSAASATLASTGGFTLGGHVSVQNNLIVHADGDIHQSGALTLSERVTLSSGADIILASASNDLNGASIAAANAHLSHVGAFTLGAHISVAEVLRVEARGAIVQSGALVQGGVLSLSASGVVVLAHGANNFEGLGIAAQGATLSDVNNMTLGDSSIDPTGALIIRLGGHLGQSGALSVSDLSVSSAAAVVLNDVGNDLGLIDISAASATIVSANAFTLGAGISVTAALTISSGGDISQSGALSLGGKHVLLSSAAAVVLENPSNELGVFAVQASSATLASADVFTLGGQISVTEGLRITAGQSIIGLGPVTLAGDASLTATAILLDNADNDLGRLTLAATDAVLADRDRLVLTSAISVSGNLIVRAGGDISQRGALILGANSSLSSAAAIVLDDFDNDLGQVQLSASSALLAHASTFTLGGQISVQSGLTLFAGGGIVQSQALVLAADISLITPGIIRLTLVGNDFALVGLSAREVTLFETGDLTLHRVSVGNMLSIRAGGDISQLAGLVLAGTGFLSSAANVLLDNADNQLGTLTLSAVSAVLANAGDFTISGLLSVSDRLTISAAGNIGQSSEALTLHGAALLSSGGAVVLNNAANDFIDAVALSAASATLYDQNDLTLAASSVSGMLVLSAAAMAVLTAADNALGLVALSALTATLENATALTLGDSSVTGALSISSGSDVSQSGSLVLGALSLRSGGGVVLTAISRIGTFNLSASSATLADVGNLTLGGSFSVQSDLSISAGGDIVQSGVPLTLLSSVLLSSSGAVVLDNPSNDFAGAVALSAFSATLYDRNHLTLAAGSVIDVLSISAAGDISQLAGLVLDGRAEFISGGNVQLDHPDNRLGGVQLNALSATLVYIGTATLGSGISVLDSLTLSVSGDIVQSGAITLAGSVLLSSSGAVVLDHASNDFVNAVSLRAASATLADRNDLRLEASSLSGALTLSAVAAVVLVDASNDFHLVAVSASAATLVSEAQLTLAGGSSVTGALSVFAVGDISQSGALTLGGGAVLSSSGAVILDHASNDLRLESIMAREIRLADGGDFTIAGLSATDVLRVTAGGDITQSEPLVLGDSSLTMSASGALVLDNPSNDFGTVEEIQLSAATATLVDANGFTLGSDLWAGVAGPLLIRASGVIHGGRKFLAPGANVSLSSALGVTLDYSGDWNYLSIWAPSAVLYHTQSHFTLGHRLSVDALTVTTGYQRDIYQSDPVTLGANDLLRVGNTGKVVLDNPSNDINLLNIFRFSSSQFYTAGAAEVTLASRGDFTLGHHVQALNVLDIRAGGTITQSEGLTLDATRTLSSAAAVVLDNPSNDLGLITIFADSATLVDIGNFVLANHISVVSGLTVSAMGAISQSGVLQLLGSTVLLSTLGDVLLTAVPSDLRPLTIEAANATLSSTGRLTLYDGALPLMGNATISASLGITQSGGLTLGGEGLFLTPVGVVLGVVLNHRDNDFNRLAVRARRALIVDRNAIALQGHTSVQMALTVIAGGDIMQFGTAMTLDSRVTLSSQGAVVLDNPANDILAGVSISAFSATLFDRDAMTLASNFQLLHYLSVQAVGSISQSGALTLHAEASMSSGSAVVLDHASNDF